MSDAKPASLGAPPFDPARHLDAMAVVLGLTITQVHRPGVLQFLAAAHAMSQIVHTAPLEGSSFEMASVFRPGRPGDGDGV
jgi:hypothetical protein